MSSTPPINPNVATMMSFVGAALTGEGEILRSLCTPDFALHEGSGLSFAGVYKGADGFLGFLGVFGETLDIERLEPIRTYLTDDPDYLICEMELVATVRATGQRFESSLLERWYLRDGKVAEIKPHYFNAM